MQTPPRAFMTRAEAQVEQIPKNRLHLWALLEELAEIHFYIFLVGTTLPYSTEICSLFFT
tara:strand:- start:63 stop:242 length:180 start_codon:yes stop_codon:yes gene_type:complete